jgi:transcriptional regulator with XRE-family HTH domain
LQQVGDVFGISAASVASWEKGKNQPDSRKLSKIAEVLGSSVEFLLNGIGDLQTTRAENIESAVPFLPWSILLSYDNMLNVSSAAEWVSPLHTKPSKSSFATRYPGSNELSWTQGPIPAGAIIFIDPEKELSTQEKNHRPKRVPKQVSEKFPNKSQISSQTIPTKILNKS